MRSNTWFFLLAMFWTLTTGVSIGAAKPAPVLQEVSPQAGIRGAEIKLKVSNLSNQDLKKMNLELNGPEKYFATINSRL